jgi:glycosyltransferase involved in cell wall biosynthesis
VKLTLVSHNLTRGDGQGRVNYELARHALREGVTVRAAADAVDGDLIEEGVNWLPVRPRLRRVNLLKVWQFARIADRALSAESAPGSVVHGNGYVTNRPLGVNTSHFVHTLWLKSPVHVSRLNRNAWGAYQALYTRLNARWEQQAYMRARVVVAVSERVRSELIAAGVPAERIRVVLNGVDTVEFHPGAADRAALGLPQAVTLALFVGDIRTPRKNLDTVLRALTGTPEIHLAVVGSTEGSPFPALAAQLGIANRVHFLGFRRDVAQIMRASDLFVFPSRYEACSLVILEAIASGLPVVTARTAGGAEVIGRDCGIVLGDPDDVSALRNALCEVHGDPALRRSMGEAARSVAERHTWSAMADKYMAIYREVCE